MHFEVEFAFCSIDHSMIAGHQDHNGTQRRFVNKCNLLTRFKNSNVSDGINEFKTIGWMKNGDEMLKLAD